MDCQNGNGIAPNVGEKIKENTEVPPNLQDF